MDEPGADQQTQMVRHECGAEPEALSENRDALLVAAQLFNQSSPVGIGKGSQGSRERVVYCFDDHPGTIRQRLIDSSTRLNGLSKLCLNMYSV